MQPTSKGTIPMAITTDQQTKILQLTQAMFNAAPGATFLAQFENSVTAGNSVFNLAQTLSGAAAFFGKSYDANLASTQFADAFINDLVGSRASATDKAWATTYIVDKMAAGATQASIISELTQALSSVSPGNANWGAAATAYNIDVATKIIDNLVGSSATDAAKAGAVSYIVGQMAVGQSLGKMIDWTIATLDSIDHTDVIWGSAATLFDNRIEVSKYYSVDKGGAATDLGTLQQALKAVTASADSVTSAKAIFNTALSGKAVDGYLSGATVFADMDGDGKQGPNEPSATTDAKGNFTMPQGTFGKLITTGGTDISTNLPFKGRLTAPAGSTVINPLTTLQQGFVEKGQSAEQAQKTVAKALGLDASKFDLTTFDPLAVALDANVSAEQRTLGAQLQAEAAKIANFIVAAGQTLTGAAGGADKLETSAVMDSLVKAMINAIAKDSNGVISFSDKAMLKSIMNESVTLSGNANLIAAAGKVAGLADSFAAMSAASADNVDKAVTTGGNITAMMINIAQAQAVAQGDMANKLLVAAAGGDLTAIQSGFIGTAFDTAANKAMIGDLDPNSTTDDAATAASNMEASEVTAPAPTFTVTQVAETTIITGSAGADNINFQTALNDCIVTGLAGNDTINTGVGNDIIRPGEGADNVNTGTGNDIVVVVGQTAASQYAQSDITNPSGSGIDLSSVITLADLNGRAVNEAVSGESIDGGAGTNRLVIYGNVDLTGVTLANITQFQVNSTVTISAQQLATLDLSVIFGDGESVLNIINSGADPVTLDLSDMSFTDFHTFNVGSGVTVVLDQADVDSLQYLSGEGTLKASTATGRLNLASKYVTLDVQDKDGNVDATHGGGTYVAGKLLIGTESAETLTGDASDDRIEGGAGNDILVGSDGNDVLRGGAGLDSMNGGAGDDTFVIVGDISGGGKVDSAADTAALGFPLTNLNGQNLNEDEDGAAEIIIGGDGDDTLYVYGTADLTNYDITGIEHIEIRSDVTFTVLQLSSIQSLRGDGASIVRINTTSGSITPEQLDLSSLSLSQIGHIAVGDNVTVQTPSVGALGGATLLSGNGSLMATSGALDLTGVTQITTLNVRNADGTLPSGAIRADAVIVSTGNVTTKVGTNGDDIVLGTSNGEILVGGDGSDRLIGEGGNDLLYGDSQSIGAFNISRDTPTVVGSNYLEQGLGGNAGFGEGVLAPNDDQSTNAIDITSVFGANGLNFFGRSFSSVYVNNNGNITFANPASQFTPGIINAGTTNPIIAPFWADVDTRGSAPNAPTPNGHSAGSNRVYYDLDSERGILTVTWDDVGYYNSRTDKLNAFQLQLLDKGEGNFDIVYRYEDINWTTGNASGGSGGLGGTVARAGYSAGTTEGYYELPQSGNQAQMLALDQNGKYVFSVRNGHTHTSSNNDTLIGGAGNDVLIGGGGEHDVAVFSGALNEYGIRSIGNTIEVADHTLLRNGKDTLFSDVEYMKFSDQEVGTASYFHSDITASELFEGAGSLSVARIATDGRTATPFALGDGGYGGGYYKLFFALSSASYVHGIEGLMGLPGMATSTSPADAHFLDYLSTTRIQFLSSDLLGISTGQNEGTQYAFSGGYYLAYDEGTLFDTSSVATVAQTSDALFLTFRGTDATSDWYDDLADMSGHYARYSPLFTRLDTYLASHHEITKVYVSGHSLGGEMAMMYMHDHPGTMFEAVTFEAANKAPPEGDDLRAINFEMRGDPVPDLGLVNNYGKSVFLDYEDSPFLTSHQMSFIRAQFDKVASTLETNPTALELNQRIYVDDNNDGLIVTNSISNLGAAGVGILADALIPVLGSVIGVAGTAIYAEDIAEYQTTGYNMHTTWSDSTNGTLVLNAFAGISGGQFNLTENSVKAVVLANDTISLSENIDITAANSTHNVVIIGNDGNNKLVGSSHDDVLIGNGNEDVLIGSNGDDFLCGGDYSQAKLDAPFAKYLLTDAGLQALADYSGGDWVDDVSYLMGGYGKDSMWGSGDNDYFFVDVNLSNNTNNVDSIKNFCSTLSVGEFSNDYMVFSGEQLGVDISQIDALLSSDLTVLGKSAAHLSSYNFQYENSITDSLDYGLYADQATFLLCQNDTGLYFDKDGQGTVFAPTLLAYIGMETANYDNLSHVNAGQILLMGSFNNLAFNGNPLDLV